MIGSVPVAGRDIAGERQRRFGQAPVAGRLVRKHRRAVSGARIEMAQDLGAGQIEFNQRIFKRQ